MCGYCIEKMVLVGMARGESFKQLGTIASAIFLQEAEDLLAAVREIKKVCKSEQVSAREHLDKEIIMARLLETTWREGVASPRYERLAWNSGIIQVMYRKEDPNRFADACTVFPLGCFQAIYQPATYMDTMKWGLFVNQPDLVADCRKLLNAYICRWLHGIGFEDYNRSQEVGFMLYNIPPFEWKRLQTALPALILSLHVLAVTGVDDELIRAIMTNDPVNAPPFDAPTLWLQRKAVELFYEAKGLSPFLPYDPNIRQILIGYLAQKKKLHRFVRKRLAKSIRDVAGGFGGFDEEEMAVLLS